MSQCYVVNQRAAKTEIVCYWRDVPGRPPAVVLVERPQPSTPRWGRFDSHVWQRAPHRPDERLLEPRFDRLPERQAFSVWMLSD